MKINKIAFVHCPVYDVETPPLGIAYLNSYLKSKNYSTKIFDFNIELYNRALDNTWWERYRIDDLTKIDELKNFEFFSDHIFIRLAKKILSYRPQVVCFSVYTTSALFSIRLAKKIRELNSECTIIFGGPAICPETDRVTKFDFKKYADILIMGEGEKTLYKTIKNLKKIKKNKKPAILRGELIKNLDKLPIPNYEDFDLKAYKGYEKGLIRASSSRGCPFNCTFCFEKHYWQIYRTRNPEEVVKEFELRKKQGFKVILFSESTINGDIKKLEKFCGELKKRKIAILWGGNANIRPEMTYRFLRRMKKAGCYMLDYGAESASRKVLKLMNKKITPFDISKTVIKTRLAGIAVLTNWIIGFPNESWFDFLKTILFLIIHRPFINGISLQICPIFRNSELDKKPSRFDIETIDGNHKKNWMNWKTINKKNHLTIRKKRELIIVIISALLLRYHLTKNKKVKWLDILKLV